MRARLAIEAVSAGKGIACVIGMKDTPKQTMVRAKLGKITFTDADVVNYDDFIPAGAFNPHNVRPWLLHDHGFVLCVVFAACLQDALDEACDAGKLEAFLVEDEELKDYGPDGDGLASLGNAGKMHDIETLGAVVMRNPPASFCAQWNAARKGSQ